MSKSCLISLLGGVLFSCVGFFSCVEYTPKPRGYFRIEPEQADYRLMSREGYLYQFNVSQAVDLLSSPKGEEGIRMCLSYPELRAKIYCDYFPITPGSFDRVMEESRTLVSRQLKEGESASEKAYSNPLNKVYGSLFLLTGECASPIQFLLTDSVSNFFRGALYFDCKSNVDSLAPAVRYIQDDIIELMQSFSWK